MTQLELDHAISVWLAEQEQNLARQKAAIELLADLLHNGQLHDTT